MPLLLTTKGRKIGKSSIIIANTHIFKGRKQGYIYQRRSLLLKQVEKR